MSHHKNEVLALSATLLNFVREEEWNVAKWAKGGMYQKRLGTAALQEQFQIFIFHIFYSVSTRIFGIMGCQICHTLFFYELPDNF